jgi:Zn-dependent alcohol dehydrogenase
MGRGQPWRRGSDHVVCSFLPVCGHCREDVNQGYRDLLDGKNVRGVLLHEH